MGGEYRLQGNSRLREKSRRRQTRISAPLSAQLVSIELPRDVPIVGIDVGEDCLDLAVIGGNRREFRFVAIPLTEIRADDPITSLTAAFTRNVPELRAGAIAIIDSPRSALDLDCSAIPFGVVACPPPSRSIDAALHRLMHQLNCNPARELKLRLSLFPSRPLNCFTTCASHPDCKPHLAALGTNMFGHLNLAANETTPLRLTGGALFTRFMIAGFAVYQALHRIGIETFEGYPYLAFSLWLGAKEKLPPKKQRNAALAARQEVLSRITEVLDEFIMPAPANLDQADAAMLAVTVACASLNRGSTLQISHGAEGRFLVAFDRVDREYLASRLEDISGASPLA